MPTQYANRDIISLELDGGFYSRHVDAMTTEGLYSKSKIAGELAWRDFQIAKLKEECANLLMANKDLSNCFDALKADYVEIQKFVKVDARLDSVLRKSAMKSAKIISCGIKKDIKCE
jgi:hypothetical protein